MRKMRRFLCGRLFPCVLFLALIAALGIFLSIKLPRLLAPAALMERALSFTAALTVIAINDLPERKIAKLMLLGFVPWMGPVLVLLFTRRAPDERLTSDAGCGTLFGCVKTLCEQITGTHVGKGALRYFASGEEMRPCLLADLAGAAQRIYLEYYIIAQGKFWDEIVRVLEKKAAEGVDVRIIFDGFGCSLTLPRRYKRQLAARDIKCAVFRPLAPAKGLTRRDHKKLFLIDDICYVGGINLADEYVGEKIRFGHWKDSAARIQGDVTSFQALFLQTWCALTRSAAENVSPYPHPGEGTFFAALADDAKDTDRLGEALFPLLISSARERLYLFSPYLSLPDTCMQALATAAAAGVDVRIMIPHIPDKRAVFFLTRAYARELLRRGVKVCEYTPGFLHAKSMLIDGKYALVSSYNLDFRSLCVQAECGVFCEDEALARALESDFLSCYAAGCEVKKASPFVRFLGQIAMLFAPLT